MRTFLDVTIVLGAFLILWLISNQLRKLDWPTKWKNICSYIFAALISLTFLLLDREGPFFGGIIVILVVFFIYTTYLTELRFKSE